MNAKTFSIHSARSEKATSKTPRESDYNFADFLKCNGGKRLEETLELYLIAADLWGDFEGNLAHLNREILIESVGNMLDLLPDTLDEDDDNFSYADYYASIDIACQPIDEIEYDLPKYFRKWVLTLKCVTKASNFLKKLFAYNSHFLTFNYTEFLESVYGIPKENILYIHGSRKDKVQLILGHGENPDANFDEWYERNKQRFTVHKHRYATKKNKKGKIIHFRRPETMTELAYFDMEPEKGNYRSAMHYYAIDTAVERIENYFEESRKNTSAIIKQNKSYFKSLSNIQTIVTLGHSLLPVDYPYFQEIITENKNASGLNWFISFYNDADIQRIERFVELMGIYEANVALFRMKD